MWEDLLFQSAFSTIQDVERFIEWYEEDGQIVSSWDTERYIQATEIIIAMGGY